MKNFIETLKNWVWWVTSPQEIIDIFYIEDFPHANVSLYLEGKKHQKIWNDLSQGWIDMQDEYFENLYD